MRNVILNQVKLRRVKARPDFFVLAIVAVAVGMTLFSTASVIIAAEAVKTRAWPHPGYARIVFDWPKRVTFDAKIQGGQLTVTFADSFETSFGSIEKHLSKYITATTPGPDSRSVAFALTNEFRLQTRRRGNSIVVDLIDQDPPAKPDTAQNKPDQPTRVQARAAQNSEVGVRTGLHAGYTRLVFDWPANTNYTANKSGESINLSFQSESMAAIAGIAKRPPQRIKTITQLRADNRLKINIAVPAEARMRHFRAGTKVVVDILSSGAPSPSRAQIASAAPKTKSPVDPNKKKRASAATEAVVSTRPAATRAPTPLIPVAVKQAASASSSNIRPEISAEEGGDDGEADGEQAVVAADIAPPPEPPAKLPEAIQVSIDGTADVPRIEVTPVPGVATAVFPRAGYLWLVIDAKIPTNVDEIPERLAGSVFLVEQRPHISATVLRIRARDDLFPLWVTDADDWALELVPRAVPPRAPVIVRREPDSQLGARVVLAVDKTGNRLTVEDPEVGDTMFVVPVNSPSGVVAGRSFLQFAIAASSRGVVVTPFADDIGVRLVRSGVEVSSDSGLLISDTVAGNSTLGGSAVSPRPAVEPAAQSQTGSSETDASKEGEEAAKPSLPDSIFRYAEWRQRPGQTFMEARDEATSKAVVTVRALRNPPRWDLTRLYFANGMAVEALGVMRLVVENDPLAVEDPVFRGIRGVAQMQMTRYDEAEPNIFYSALDGDPGIHLWRGAWHAFHENWLEAHQEFIIAGENAFALFPPKERATLRIAAVKAALEQEDFESTDLILTSLVAEAPTDALRAQAQLLVARAKDILEDPLGAMEAVATAIAYDDRLGRAEGNYLKTELQLKYDEIKPDEAIKRLEALRFAWRGGDYEFKLLNRVANLQIDQERFSDALKSLREIITYFPDDDASKEAGSRMDELFRDLFLNGRANNLDPINALALFFDFRELTPGGRDGDQMIRILADRMAAVDLLDGAAQLLDHQVKFRLRGEPKARVGARVAVIHLLDQKPSQALRILRASRWVNLPKELDAERRLLEARALVELDRDDEALKLIEADATRSAELIRSEIHWRRKEWVKVAASLESILGDRWKAEAPLGEIEQTQVLRVAVALTFEDNRAGLDSLRRRYNPKMQAGANASGFDLLTGNFDRTKTAFRELS